ncbi:MAG: SIS domain-containing protein [Firmicutes bacterium]|nr:SIS domain-containing protein [Bacillota bacterium]
MTYVLGVKEDKLKEIDGYITAKEIKQQPKLWRETFDIIKENKEKLEEFLNRAKKDKVKVIFTGAGSSSFVGDSVLAYLKRELSLNVESIATTDIVSNPENYLDKETPTLLISCARSGNSPESKATVELAEKMVDNLYQIFLTCNPNGTLAKKASGCDRKLLLLMPEDSNDQGFAMTGSFSSMVLASILLFKLDNLDSLESNIYDIANVGEKILTEKIDLIKDLTSLDYNRAIFLGSSSIKGMAKEAALKTLELTRGKVITQYDSSLGFRHGPKSIINDKTLVFSFLSNDAYTRKYEIDLLKEMSYEDGDKKIVGITYYEDESVKKLVDYYISIDDNKKEDIFSLFSYLLIAQMYAFNRSVILGNTPDNPSPDGTVNRVVKGVEIYPYKG